MLPALQYSERLAAVGGKPWKDIGGQSQISPLNGTQFVFIAPHMVTSIGRGNLCRFSQES
jgi:hypothetical protein